MELSEEILSKYDGDEELYSCCYELEALQQEYGPLSDEAVMGFERLARALDERGEFWSAISLLSRARSLLEERGEPFHPLMASLLTSLGEVYLNQEMVSEASPYFEKALAIKDALSVDEDLDTAFLHMKVGEINLFQKLYTNAEQQFLKAFQILSLVAPENNVALGDVCHNIGILFFHADKPERAYSYLERAAGHRSAVDGHSAELLATLEALGRVASSQGDTDGAIHAYEQALQILSLWDGDTRDEVERLSAVLRGLDPRWEPMVPEQRLGSTPNSSPKTEFVESSLSPQVLSALAAAAHVALSQNRADIAEELLSLMVKVTSGVEESRGARWDVLKDFIEKLGSGATEQ